MKKQGFTMIELLAVIMILAFIMAITIPSVKKAINASEDKLYNVAVSQIVKGAKQYVLDAGYDIPNLYNTGAAYVTINDLVTKGILETTIENPKTGELFKGSEGVKITKMASGNYQYEFLATGLLAEVLVVAGGGGGGGGNPACDGNGGGGAGGLVHESAFVLDSSTTYPITVGGGGAGGAAASASRGTNGSNSVFGSLTALGGGGGGSDGAGINGLSGGSGGGAGTSSAGGIGGSGTTDQGYAGGLANNPGGNGPGGGGGGGGGAGGTGGNGSQNLPGGNGGVGLAFETSGTLKYYAGGGGGASWNRAGGTGGQGGGGNGASRSGAYAATASTANTGGGGGAGTASYASSAGASGIVIIKYQGSAKATGGTITSVGGYTIHTFTTTGSSNFVVSKLD